MKSETAKRYIAVFLIFAMVITAISFSSIRAHEDNSISPIDMRETGSVYVLDVSELEIGAIPASMPAGTENYFTLHGGDGAEIQNSNRSFDGGYSATKRINFPNSMNISNVENLIEFSTKSAASVTVWFVASNDDREIMVCDPSDPETPVYSSNLHTKSNEMYIDTFSLDNAGTYYLGGNPNNYYYKISVAESVPENRGDWEIVNKPQITDVEQVGENIEVTVMANVGADGGDRVTVEMFRDGERVESKSSASGNPSHTHTVTFKPDSSGTYTFTAILFRDGEVEKTNDTSNIASVDYVLPLGIPVISSIFNEGVIDETGKGNVYLIWSEVDEAKGYNIYCDGNLVASTDKTKYTVTGIDIAEHTFTVTAVRGTDESVPSNAETINVTEEKEDKWDFVVYGPSSNGIGNDNNYAENDDGTVTVWSENGRGKVQPSNPDGLALYYTKIPNDLDFTFRTNVSVDSWTFSNGQEGFGLLALDRVPDKSSVEYFWTNQYMAAVSKINYRYDPDVEGGVVYSGGTEYTMLLGVGVNTKLGLTPEKLNSAAGDDTAIKNNMTTSQRTLDTTAGELGLESDPYKAYNIVGNYVGDVKETIAGEKDGENKGITDFLLEIRRAKNGYVVSYFDQEGKLIREQKYYDADSLSKLDGDYVYVGFFASRNARATFSVDEFKIYESYEELPAQELIKEKPAVSIKSGPSSSTENYTLILTANVSGTAVIGVTQNGEPIEQKDQSRSDAYTKTVNIKKDERTQVELTVAPDEGRPILNIESLAVSSELGLEFDFASDNEANSPNLITIAFTPDANAGNELEDGYELDYDYVTNDPVITTHYVEYNTYFADQKNLYIAPVYDPTNYESPDDRPFGSPTGNGSPTCPLDIYSAVNFVHPGQNIIIMPGLYRLDYPVIIQRGIDGEKENTIKMIPMTDENESEDSFIASIPESEKYFIFCFREKSSGIKCGGDYWYFNGFDVKNTTDGECGFYVCGSDNKLERIHAYYNGNTGIQISAFNNSDDFTEDWPENNTILNCTSCFNADLGQQDADGFAAKLTVGNGNVFDGCVAFNNSDDGFDMFSNVATGPIGVVVVQNCVAYRNGYDADNNITNGNGTGFKMGGSNIYIGRGNDGTPSGHKLINSIAFENKENGITSNSCPDIYIEHCTSFNNGRNIYLYTTDSGKETVFTVDGLVSFSNSADATKLDDKIQCNKSDSSNYKSTANYYYENGSSFNSINSPFTADMFKSTEFKDDIVKRYTNGNINLGEFLAPAVENFTGAVFETKDGDNTDLRYEQDIDWPHLCGTTTTPVQPTVPGDTDTTPVQPTVPGDTDTTPVQPTVPSDPDDPDKPGNSTVHFNVPPTDTTSESESVGTVSEPVTAATTTEPAITIVTTTTSAPITTMPIVSDTTEPVDSLDPFRLDEDTPEGNRNLADPNERNPYTGVTAAAVVPVALAALSVTGEIIVKRKNGKK
ncbi:MAG: hypothetical protein HDT47_09990 [Ruminococcaceae bacterium]|nr:hypothetical protein [Oscillospiraceae bacterium]